jgi:2-amino-4-hydroxy-6-hydroxymethyldihydropteridine diphosphokinase
MTTICYIGLGANLADPERQIDWALRALDRLPASRLEAAAPRYRSRAIGPQPQPDYLNTVARLRTALEPLALLRELQALEAARGRVRGVRWGPRPLDLDILLYGDLQLSLPELTIPHPRIAQRNFVLVPLLDLDPQVRLPDGTAIAGLLARTSREGIVRVCFGGTQ